MTPRHPVTHGAQDDPDSHVAHSQYSPSLSPTSGEATEGTHRRNVLFGVAVLVGAALLVAPPLLQNLRGPNPPPPRIGVLDTAAAPAVAPVSPQVEASSASPPGVDEAGTHQFIQIEETLIVGIVDVEAPARAR